MKKLICSLLTELVLLLSFQMPTASFGANKKLEVFSWWTSGGEAAALDALFQATKKADPGVELINATVAGGGGSAARPVLQARLAGGNPPDSWQVHPGWELLGQYVEANYCEPISDIYQSEGWDKVVPKGLIDMMTKTIVVLNTCSLSTAKPEATRRNLRAQRPSHFHQCRTSHTSRI